MNVGTLTISLAARTAALTAASSRVKAFEMGIVASAQRANRSMLMLGQTFSALTIPIAAIGVTATKMFSDFEYSLAKVQGLVGIAAQTVQEWGNQILKMGPQVAKSPKELAEALYFVTSAGIRGVETMEVLEMSALAASAGLGETKAVADAVTSAMNAYGKENLSAAEATDILVMAVREGKVVAEDLASSIGKVFPIAAQMGVSFNEVGAGIAAMTRTGTTASTSAIYLRRVLSSMLRPAGQAESAMYGMGESFYDLRQTLQKEGGLLTALLKIRKLVDDFGEEEVAEAFPNIRALIPILDIIGKNLEDNKRIWQNMLNPIGALDQAVEAASKTFKWQWDQAVSKLETSLVYLGKTLKTVLIPVINDVVEWISKAVGWWTSLDAQTQQLIIRITLLVGAVGPLTVVIGGLANAILNLIGLLWSSVRPIMLVVVRFGMLLSILKQLIAIDTSPLGDFLRTLLGVESKIGQQSSLEKFMSNLGVYLNILLTKIKIFAIQIGVIFGDMFSGILNNLTGAVNLLIQTYNFIMPMKGLDLPEFVPLDLGGYLRDQLKDAETQLQKFMDLRPGGAQGWNWAEQLFGGNSEASFKEASKDLWNGMKDDAVSVINLIKEQISKIIPSFNFSGGGATPELVKMPEFAKSLPKAESLDKFRTSLLPLYFEEMGKAFSLFHRQMNIINTDFDKYGYLIDISTEKQNSFNKLLDKFRQRKGIIPREALIELNSIYKELAFEDFDRNLQKINADYAKFGNLVNIAGEKQSELNTLLEKLRKGDIVISETELNRVKELTDQINALNVGLAKIDEFKGFFSAEELDKMKQALAGMNLTEQQMQAVMGVAKLLGETLSEVAVGIGNAWAGMENPFMGLVDMLLQAAVQLGKTMIMIGSILAFFMPGKAALFILGGMALVAMGTATSAYVEKRREDANSATGLASGGIIGPGYPNDTFNARLSTNEAVIPLDRLPQLLGINRNDKQKVIYHIKGTELEGILVKQSKVHNAF